MVEDSTGDTGLPRGGDRRGRERRRTDRRSPTPWWRRPWAFAGYGVAGTLLLFLAASSMFGRRDAAPLDAELTDAPPPRLPAPEHEPPPAATLPPEDAFGSAGFERLVVEGDAATGRLVRTTLFCNPPQRVAMGRTDRVETAVSALADEQGRVPAAECKWGERGTTRREDFLLLVPPELAEAFAGSPEVTDSFVRRRQIAATLEWIGRSDALSLRTAGVLRRVGD
jgi:hypothetical protein